jgi:hypothetical protein
LLEYDVKLWMCGEDVQSHGDGDGSRARGLFDGRSTVVSSSNGRESREDGEELHFGVGLVVVVWVG